MQAVDAMLSEQFARQAPADSFDRSVLERIALAERADRTAAQARIEQEWRTQRAALAHHWRYVCRTLTLNGLAVTALLIALMQAFSVLPAATRFVEHIGSLTQYVAARPQVAFSVAAVTTVVALWLIRALDLFER